MDGQMLKRFLTDDSGATAIEYGLIVAMIFLAIVTSIHYYTEHMATMYNKIGDSITGATNLD